MGNYSSTDVFPVPLASSTLAPPPWAIAIIAAAASVTFLWLSAILVLVLYEVIFRNGKRGHISVHDSFRAARASSSTARDGVKTSLGTPPPPIPSPTSASALGGLQLAMDIPDGKVGLDEEREFKLRRESEDDNASLCSSDSSFISNASMEEKATLIVSQSVRCGAAADTGATDIPCSEGDSLQETPLAGMVLSRPVTLRQLGATIREPNYIETEFRKLPSLNVLAEELPAGTERKNRYTNVLPSPKTRVELPQIFGHPNSDYINGNYIRGYRSTPVQYIATQGPLESTIEDFWRMILENNTSVIIMATNFQERGIEKCSRYWPAQGSEEYGSVQVTLLQQTAHGTYNTSVLQIQAAGIAARTVTHYRLTFWPHQGVPKETKIVTDFLRSVKMADGTSPAVVHCSSGIGRTGVLLACDIGMQGILQGEQKIDVLRIVSTLRQDRAGMVQTREQYRFIHQALYNVSKEEGTK